MVYYQKENINVNNELNFLNYVYVKHNFKRFNLKLFKLYQFRKLIFQHKFSRLENSKQWK